MAYREPHLDAVANEDSVLAAVKAELALLPAHLMDTYIARTAKRLASVVDQPENFKSQSISSNAAQLMKCMEKLEELAKESGAEDPRTNAVNEIAEAYAKKYKGKAV